MIGSKSIPGKVLKALTSGKTLTPRQIQSRFKAANPHDPVYALAEQGYIVDRQYRLTKNGRRTVIYSMA